MRNVHDRIATAVVRIAASRRPPRSPPAEAAPDEQVDAERDERVAGEVEDVGDARERLLADHLVAVPHEVAGDEQGLAGRHEQPRQAAIRAVAPDRRRARRRRRRPDGVVDELWAMLPVASDRVQGERSRPGGEIGRPERDPPRAGVDGRTWLVCPKRRGWTRRGPMTRRYRPGWDRRSAVRGRESTKPPVARRLQVMARAGASVSASSPWARPRRPRSGSWSRSRSR